MSRPSKDGLKRNRLVKWSRKSRPVRCFRYARALFRWEKRAWRRDKARWESVYSYPFELWVLQWTLYTASLPLQLAVCVPLLVYSYCQVLEAWLWSRLICGLIAPAQISYRLIYRRKTLLMARALAAPEKLRGVKDPDRESERADLLRNLENARRATDVPLVEEILVRLCEMYPQLGILPESFLSERS